MLQTLFTTTIERTIHTTYGNTAVNIFQSHHVKIISLFWDLSGVTREICCTLIVILYHWHIDSVLLCLLLEKKADEVISYFKLCFTVMTLFYFKFVHILSMLSSWQLAPMSPRKKTKRHLSLIAWHFFPSFQSNAKNINQSMPIIFCVINKQYLYSS